MATSEHDRQTDAAPSSDYSLALGVVTHAIALVTWVLGPLAVMWLSRSEYVAEHARHAFNWQLTVGIVWYVAGVLWLAALLVSDSRLALWSVLLGLVSLGGTILFCTVAAISAARGTHWEYPLSLRIKETTTVSRAF